MRPVDRLDVDATGLAPWPRGPRQRRGDTNLSQTPSPPQSGTAIAAIKSFFLPPFNDPVATAMIRISSISTAVLRSGRPIPGGGGDPPVKGLGRGPGGQPLSGLPACDRSGVDGQLDIGREESESTGAHGGRTGLRRCSWPCTRKQRTAPPSPRNDVCGLEN
jgi:hypothetical protein